MLLCIAEGQKEDCLLVQESRLKTFNVLICFERSCWKRVEMFYSPFVVTGALAHVRFLSDGASSLASMNPVEPRRSAHWGRSALTST